MKKKFEPVVIEVTEVAPATTPLPEVASRTAMEFLLKAPPSPFPNKVQDSTEQQSEQIEACSCGHEQLVANIYFHPVIAALHHGFQDHRPVILSPDIIWLLITQGFANHVNNNAEKLRPQLVNHTEKVTLSIRRNNFIKGSPENPWPEVFEEFTSQIRQHIGSESHELLQPTFSTTGTTEKAATQIVLLNAVQSYFSYSLLTMCGIPQIILEGTTEDWKNLKKRFDKLAQFDLSWWVQILSPILEEFISASQGQINPAFWQSIYKWKHSSGGPYITGWITAFFPYIKGRNFNFASEHNNLLVQNSSKLLYPNSEDNAAESYAFYGMKTDNFPSGLACAPFSWKYLDRSYGMEFLGGFIGIRQTDEKLSLKPEIGWAVLERSQD